MKKITILAATAASILASAAIAQQTTPGATPANPGTTAPSATMAPTTTAPTMSFIDMQSSDQWLASNLIGMSVRGPANESLGEINDVVVARDGRVIGAVIGVGGFLGIGEKDVAVPFQQVEMVRNSDSDAHAVVRRTKDELKAAPTFKEYEAQKSDAATRTPAQPATTR